MKNSKRILEVKIRRVIDQCPDTSHLGEYSDTRTSEFSIDRKHSEDCAAVSPVIAKAKAKLERIADHLRDVAGDCICVDAFSWYGHLYGNGHDERCCFDTDADEAADIVQELADSLDECDCSGGDMSRHEYRYFNPSFNYVTKNGTPADGLTPEDVRKYTRQDYERMERLNRGDWSYVGVSAEARIGIPHVGAPACLTVQKITSGGLYGIESDSEREYFDQIRNEQLSELRHQLQTLGFSKRAISAAFKNVQDCEEFD